MRTVDLTGETLHANAAVGGGEELVLRLPESPSTGHRWFLEHLPDGVELLDDGWVGEGRGIGAAGVRELRLRATVPVQGVVALRLRRPWLDPSDDDPVATIALVPA
jgi:predicted secreted protein